MKSFIENAMANLRVDGEIDSNYLDVEKVNYFKHKNGYINYLNLDIFFHFPIKLF